MPSLNHPANFSAIERRMLRQAHEGSEVTLRFPEKGSAFTLRQRLYKLRKLTAEHLDLHLNVTMPNPTKEGEHWVLRILPGDKHLEHTLGEQLGNQLEQIEAEDYLEDSGVEPPSALNVYLDSEADDREGDS